MKLDDIDVEFLSELAEPGQLQQELAQLKEWLDEYHVHQGRND